MIGVGVLGGAGGSLENKGLNLGGWGMVNLNIGDGGLFLKNGEWRAGCLYRLKIESWENVPLKIMGLDGLVCLTIGFGMVRLKIGCWG